jgi:hypothetical protein
MKPSALVSALFSISVGLATLRECATALAKQENGRRWGLPLCGVEQS